MIFLWLEDSPEQVVKVRGCNYMPFDPTFGLGKTEEELRELGALVESIPDAEKIEGKRPIMLYDKVNESIVYEYEDSEQNLSFEEEIAQLKAQNAEILFALVSNDLM